MNNDIFTEYVNRYSATVYRVAYGFLRNPADSEDILQDVFIKLYGCGKRFADDQHVKAWLIRVTINLSKNHLRQAKRRCTEPTSESTMCYASEVNTDLAEALESLDETHRTAVYLYYYEGYDVREISSFLGISESGVKMRLKRARDKLKSFLTDEKEVTS